MFINVDTGQYPITEENIRSTYPNTSFPKPFREFGPYKEVKSTDKPDYNEFTQIVIEDTPKLNAAGEYEQTWVIQGIERTPEDLESFIEAKALTLLAQFTTRKKELLATGFYVNGILYDYDSNARLAYLELDRKFQEDPEYLTYWEASKGQWVPMDAKLWSKVKAAKEEKVSILFTKQAMLEQALAKAVITRDTEAISKIKINI